MDFDENRLPESLHAKRSNYLVIFEMRHRSVPPIAFSQYLEKVRVDLVHGREIFNVKSRWVSAGLVTVL